uniref:Uncharacterized protein n=1 Tax=Rhizophora mucronata TaxID=61149 RepID=A0A2P2N6S7_RHIMU
MVNMTRNPCFDKVLRH